MGASRKVAIGLLAWVLAFVLMLLLAANVGAAQVGPGADAPAAVPVAAVVGDQGRALFPPGYVVPSAPAAVGKKKPAADQAGSAGAADRADARIACRLGDAEHADRGYRR